MPPTNTTLKGFTDINSTLLTTQLEQNITQFFTWSFLETENYVQNIQIPSSGVYGGNKHELRLLEQPGYTDGQIWEGYRDQWIWESGLQSSVQPIAISGVNVNGTFYPIGTSGAFAYSINYPKGQIVFDTAISTSSTVTCEYSVRRYNVYNSSNTPWLSEIFEYPDRIDSKYFSQTGSGHRVLSGRKISLPAIVIDIQPFRRSLRGVGLGGGQYLAQGVYCYIFAHNQWDRNQLFDAITYQVGKNIEMFDIDLVESNSGWLVNNDIANTTVTYPDWVKATDQGGYNSGLKMRIMDSVGEELMRPKQNLYTALVYQTYEIGIPLI